MKRYTIDQKFRIHGALSQYSNCEDESRPVCQECQTGMVCDQQNDTHFCGYQFCTAYDVKRMSDFRLMANAVMSARRRK